MDGSKLLDSLSEENLFFSKYDRSQATDLLLAILYFLISDGNQVRDVYLLLLLSLRC